MARITVFVLALVAVCCAAPSPHTDDNNTGHDGEDQRVPKGGSEELQRMRRYLVGELGDYGHGGGGFGGGYGGHGPHGHGGLGGHGLAVPLSQSYSKSSATASSSSGSGGALLG